MKKLLLINVSANSGSTGRIAEEIGQTAIEHGYESYFAYGRAGRESKSHLIRIGSDFDIKVHGLETRLFDNHGFSSKLATKKFIEEIERIQPDVINLHNVHGYYLNVEIFFKYLATKNIPLVWTLHDCWPFTGHCSYFDRYNCVKWQTGCHNCPGKIDYPTSLFLDRSRQNYNKKKALFTALQNVTFVPVCQWMGNIVSQSFMKNATQRVIYNGINLDVFQPQSEEIITTLKKRYQIGNKKMVLGVANIWDKRKGLKDFCWLNGNLPGDYQIVLVGLSKKQISELPQGIIGINRTENVQELAAFYSAADVFVNPTYIDNFPTTNIESLACGTPVITYNTGGSPEAVDEQTGAVVEKGDLQNLKSAVEELASHKEAYSNACRKRAVKCFNKNERFEDYVGLFDIIING